MPEPGDIPVRVTAASATASRLLTRRQENLPNRLSRSEIDVTAQAKNRIIPVEIQATTIPGAFLYQPAGLQVIPGLEGFS
jgi:hypothetical protein